MQAALLFAAVLILAIGAAHSFLGERFLIGPLVSSGRRQGLLERSEFARRTLRFAWHLTTIAWWGFAAILLGLVLAPAASPARSVLVVVAATFFVTGMATLASSRGRHFAWPVFLAIAGLLLVPLF
ncbi:MAG: hypothetical protein ABSC22_14360 [Roseiarcus sp.]|jgi:hypothetical protein